MEATPQDGSHGIGPGRPRGPHRMREPQDPTPRKLNLEPTPDPTRGQPAQLQTTSRGPNNQMGLAAARAGPARAAGAGRRAASSWPGDLHFWPKPAGVPPSGGSPSRCFSAGRIPSRGRGPTALPGRRIARAEPQCGRRLGRRPSPMLGRGEGTVARTRTGCPARRTHRPRAGSLASIGEGAVRLGRIQTARMWRATHLAWKRAIPLEARSSSSRWTFVPAFPLGVRRRPRLSIRNPVSRILSRELATGQPWHMVRAMSASARAPQPR